MPKPDTLRRVRVQIVRAPLSLSDEPYWLFVKDAVTKELLYSESFLVREDAEIVAAKFAAKARTLQ